MTKPQTLKLLMLLFTNILFLSCSEPDGQATAAAPGEAKASQDATDRVTNGFQAAGLGADGGEWQAYGGGLGSTKYTALDDTQKTPRG